MTEFATSWDSRSEPCQMMREQNVMTNGVTVATTSIGSSASSKRKQQQQQQNEMSANHPKTINMGSANVDWNLLLKMRSWLLSVLKNENEESEDNISRKKNLENAREIVRSLLLGSPLTHPIILDDPMIFGTNHQEGHDDAAEAEQHEKRKQENDENDDDEPDDKRHDDAAEKQHPPKAAVKTKAISADVVQKQLDLISECDWETLVEIAKNQIDQVMDSFLKKHGVLK